VLPGPEKRRSPGDLQVGSKQVWITPKFQGEAWFTQLRPQNIYEVKLNPDGRSLIFLFHADAQSPLQRLDMETPDAGEICGHFKEVARWVQRHQSRDDKYVLWF